MTRVEWSALIARVEAAEGPDRELDGLIYIAAHIPAERAGRIDHNQGVVGWWPKDGAYVSAKEAPRYTASLDAAAALVPEGHNWSLDVLLQDGNEARTFYGAHPHEIDTEATGATPALALTAAALRARQAMQMEGEG